MRLIKDNFYTVVKLWLDQFAMMFFGILMLLSTGKSSIEWLMPAASIFSVLFYLLLLFWTCCEAGLQDSVRIEGGRMKMQWYKCTVLALVANLPSIVASIIACISKAMIPNVGFLSSAEGAQGSAASVYSVSTIINEILHIMYQGILVTLEWDTVPFFYLFAVLISVTVCTIGYIGGTKGWLANLLSKKKVK